MTAPRDQSAAEGLLGDEEIATPPLQPITTYTDEGGRTITVYPARYAEGCLVEPCTARPRRGQQVDQ